MKKKANFPIPNNILKVTLINKGKAFYLKKNNVYTH